ncbi:MAG: AEC family transporter [Lachnospiraceae bacterium]|nr:AEC family transporter [Lachnospiraceae bacterium]
MLDSLCLSLQVVVPLVLFMGLGGIIRQRKWVSPVSIREMNGVVYKVLLSTLIFYNIYQSDMAENFDLGLLIYAVVSILVTFGFLCLLIGKWIKDTTIAPVVIQGIYRSNFVLFGLQVTASICGSDQLGMTTVLISVIIPLFNVLSVVLFESYRRKSIDFKNLFHGFLINPLIIASVLGLLSVFSGIQFGSVIEDVLKSISQMATPMSLILLGGTITLDGVKKYWRYTLVCVMGRLLVIPAIFLTIAAALGYRGAGLVGLMVMFGSPTSVSSFPMAVQMGGNGELAGQIVAVTTVFSTVSIFFWTYVLSVGGFIP